MGSVTAAHNKSDVLELRIFLYIYFKSWDLRGDPLPMGLFKDLCRSLCLSVLLCQRGAVLTATKPLPPGALEAFLLSSHSSGGITESMKPCLSCLGSLLLQPLTDQLVSNGLFGREPG